MERFKKSFEAAVRAIENCASLINSDVNVEEYFYEAFSCADEGYKTEFYVLDALVKYFEEN